MKKYVVFVVCVLINTIIFSQEIVKDTVSNKEETMSLLFMGDVMGHGVQVKAAYNEITKNYDYYTVFAKVSPLINSVDFAIANLEVTLAGKPYKGYPQFSSPDALAVACKNSGIDALVTANNHSCDRRKKGIERTIKVLDSLYIKHTGTFKTKADRDLKNLLILTKNSIRVGILNYTYGTNGIAIPKPNVVNLINKNQMLLDIKSSKKENLDKLIVVLHWGKEYKLNASKEQEKLATFLFENEVDIIVGSHPHVVQKMVYTPANKKNKERFIAYSLGNFISNQRTAPRDGGAMLRLTIGKKEDKVKLNDYGYYLTWVNKPMLNNKPNFEILPCTWYEFDDFYLDDKAKKKMKSYIKSTRAFFKKNNINVKEIK